MDQRRGLWSKFIDELREAKRCNPYVAVAASYSYIVCLLITILFVYNY